MLCGARAPGLDPPLQRLTFPYQGVAIPGWLRKPRESARPPVAIPLPGLDACKEELHAWAAAFVARGVAALTIDGPGQGEISFSWRANFRLVGANCQMPYQRRFQISSLTRSLRPLPSTRREASNSHYRHDARATGVGDSGILDGPLALDNAISEDAAAIKHIVSPVAGRADVLDAPDLEGGNMLAKCLTFLAAADAAGIVLGARVPIILTSRADSVITRLASCAVASLVAEARRRKTSAAIS
jgi:hypothetical protein